MSFVGQQCPRTRASSQPKDRDDRQGQVAPVTSRAVLCLGQPVACTDRRALETPTRTKQCLRRLRHSNASNAAATYGGPEAASSRERSTPQGANVAQKAGVNPPALYVTEQRIRTVQRQPLAP